MTDDTYTDETVTRSISIPQSLLEVAEHQVEQGLSDNVSEWFRDAAYARLSVQEVGVEMLGKSQREAHNIIDPDAEVDGDE